MKKSTLALSVAAALGGLGFVSNALAIGDVSGAAAGTALVVNPNGVGHQLVFPYYTAQGDNSTMINITNTDLANGKVVKVRFRGAANSDDLYDFTLLLSPGDVWTAAVSRDVTTGLAKLVSTDTSCVLPAIAKNSVFSTLRADPSAAVVANETREGYIEVITMANIPVAGAIGAATLYGTTTHVQTGAVGAGVPKCDATVLATALGGNPANRAAALALGMANPTGGLTGDWIILNQVNTAAWSGPATALQVEAGGTPGVAVGGNLVFWPQEASLAVGAPTLTTPLGVTNIGSLANVTADPLLLSGVVAVKNYDLPDLSTPYADTTVVVGTDNSASSRADATTAALAIRSLKHQIVTNPGIAAVTDVVMAQPTRRYNVGVNYKATTTAANSLLTTGTSASAVYRGALATTGNTTVLTGAAIPGTATTFYTAANTGFGTAGSARQVCITNLSGPGQNALFDMEEGTPGAQGGFVISPQPPSASTIVNICGEAAVVSINQGGATLPSSALTGSVARSDVTFTTYAVVNGWANWDFTQGGTVNAGGFPVLGSTFLRARNDTVNYGFAYTHKGTK